MMRCSKPGPTLNLASGGEYGVCCRLAAGHEGRHASDVPNGTEYPDRLEWAPSDRWAVSSFKTTAKGAGK